MAILLRTPLSIAVAVILGLFMALPSPGQTSRKADNTADPIGYLDGDYPQMPAAVMNAELTRADGTKFRLRDLRGKVVLLNLWGIWCGPCRYQVPTFIELQKKYGAQRFEVVGINIGNSDGDPEALLAIKKYGAKFHINYQLVRPPDKTVIRAFFAVSKYEVVPQAVLIGIDGTIRGIFIGAGNKVDTLMIEGTKLAIADYETLSILQGSTSDAAGAAIPNVLITARSADGKKFETHSDGDGEYVIALPSAVYSITFTRQPFDTLVIPKYLVGDHAKMTLDFNLTCDHCEVVND